MEFHTAMAAEELHSHLSAMSSADLEKLGIRRREIATHIRQRLYDT